MITTFRIKPEDKKDIFYILNQYYIPQKVESKARESWESEMGGEYVVLVKEQTGSKLIIMGNKEKRDNLIQKIEEVVKLGKPRVYGQ